MTPAEHDQKSAVISHLPHATAVMLAELADDLGGLEIASTGFAGATRLACSNPPMRADIMTANRQQLIAALDALIDRADDLKHQLSANDREALLDRLKHAQSVREVWMTQREHAK